MTQRDHILKLIQEAGSNGIGGNELRNISHAVDVPKCVSDLRKIGYPIESTENGDGTKTYYLSHIEKPQWVLQPSGGYGWSTTHVIKVEAPKKRKSNFPAWEEYRRDDGSIGYRTI